MHRFLGAVCGAFLLVLGACGSSGGPSEFEGRDLYEYEFDFLWEEAQRELKDQWRVAKADLETKTIETEWDERLSPLRSQGFRHRLRVAFEPVEERKWRVRAFEESERNDEIEKPLDPAEASWSSSKNEGALALKFLVNFDRRMRPNEAWRRETKR